MDALVVPMMRLWEYAPGFGASARKVWVSDVEAPRVFLAGATADEFFSIESRAVQVYGLSSPAVGSAHFIDDARRIWFVGQVLEVAPNRHEVAIARYGLRTTLGHNIPADRADAAWSVPSGWTWVDAARVPVRVVRVESVTLVGNVARFQLSVPAGDSAFEIQTGRYEASQRLQGGLDRAGTLIAAFTPNDWFFSPTSPDGNVYLPPDVNDEDRVTPLGPRRGLDQAVFAGDFFVLA